MNQWRAPYNRYINKRILKDATRLRETRNYTAILMIPINSTLKIVGAGNARRHLETGFRLTHIPPPLSCPPNATTSLPNSDPHSLIVFRQLCPQIYIPRAFPRPFSPNDRRSPRRRYLEGAISSSSLVSREKNSNSIDILHCGIEEFNVARDRKIRR